MQIDDPLGRSAGQPLDPERHTVSDLHLKAENPRSWASLWQQNPRISGGNLIKSEWFNIMPRHELPKRRELYTVRGWDLAYTKKEVAKRDPDFTVGVKLSHWRYDGDNLFIIEQIVRWQDNWPATKRRIRTYAQNDGFSVKIGIESGGPQKGLAEDVRADNNFKGHRIVPILPIHDKVARAQPWIDHAENGNIYLVEGEWVTAFLAECEGFPNSSSHDDQIDAVSIAYEMLKNRLRGKSVSTMKLSGLYT